MSIVTLKKKSRSFQDHISGRGHDGFSLVGGHRNIGVVGPTNLAKSVTRTQFRGNAPMGHGGCCGTYKVSICNSGSCSTNDPAIIKSTVKNTKGAILKQYKWIHSAYPHFWVKPDDSMPENYSQGIYIRNLTAKNSTCVLDKMDTGIKNCDSYVDKYQEVQVPILEYIYPPSLLSSTLDTTTLTGQPYGNGTYNVSYSQQESLYPARNLFDGYGSWRLDAVSIINGWVQLELPIPIVLKSYQVNTEINDNNGVPTRFKLEGSNDNFSTIFLLNTTDWTINQYSRTIIINPPLDITQSYKYYRLTNLQNGYSTSYIEFKYPLIFYQETNPLFEYPSAPLTNATTTVSGKTYGNGTYQVIASSQTAIYPAYQAFDDTVNYWRSGINKYPTTTSSTSTSTTDGTVYGEYIQLQLPYEITLKSFLILNSTSTSPRPKQIKLLGSNNTANTWNILYKEPGQVPFNTAINVNATQSYSYYRVVVETISNTNVATFTEIREITLFVENSSNLTTSRTELVPIRERVQCKAASYHIGGKKIYRSFYSKDSNTRPVSSSQYIISGLYKKNNLLKPPCHNNSI